jgi:uncharacterized protein (DUF924 family)
VTTTISPTGPSAGLPSAAEVVQFWSDAGPQRWFRKDEAFDHEFRERFLAAHEAAARGELAHWERDPQGALALIVLLDQLPRNAFRGQARTYATDAQALALALRAIDAGFDREVAAPLRRFFYLPLMHSERLQHHDRAVELAQALGDDTLHWAQHHREVLRRFGRFPHRNALLGRQSTPDELRFLEEGGFGG